MLRPSPRLAPVINAILLMLTPLRDSPTECDTDGAAVKQGVSQSNAPKGLASGEAT